MDIDDETTDAYGEIGSDELLSDESLRLPESANILVRIHAVRAWLARRREETTLELGEAALQMQEMAMQGPQGARLRRRERQNQEEKQARIQEVLSEKRQRLSAYEEAQTLLEDCIIHTSGERVLVEYYLALEDLAQSISQTNLREGVPQLSALAEVQHRVEHVGSPNEED